jgi:hypothetical protein
MFSPTAFEGILHNAAGENSGSCKLFAHELQTLKQQHYLVWRLLSRRRFGDPEGTSHKHSQLHENWLGRCILWEALELKKTI